MWLNMIQHPANGWISNVKKPNMEEYIRIIPFIWIPRTHNRDRILESHGRCSGGRRNDYFWGAGNGLYLVFFCASTGVYRCYTWAFKICGFYSKLIVPQFKINQTVKSRLSLLDLCLEKG